MRQLIVLFAVLFTLVHCKSAKEVVETMQEPITSMNKIEKGIFFKIEKPETEPSYLLGIINSIDHENYVWGDQIESKVIGADRILLEQITDYENLDGLTKASLLPENTTMKDYVSDEEYEHFVKFMQDSMEVSHRVFEGLYAKLKPVFLEQLAVVHYIGQNPVSYDNNITVMGENNNIELIGLESLIDKIGFYDQVPLENQYAELVRSITSGSKGESKYHATVAAYKEQNLSKLEQLLSEQFEELPNYETLMYERRLSWLPKIETAITEGNSFIAIGIGQLLGENGMLQLLQQKGYSLETLNIE